MNLDKPNLSKSEQEQVDKDFYEALYAEDFELAGKLLTQGANIEKRNVRDETILFLFAMKEKFRVMDWLVEQKADVNSENMVQDTILSNALLNKKWFLADWALKNTSDLNRENRIGATPLIQCINSKNLEFFQKLLKAGADPDYITSTGNNALLVACSKNTADFMGELLPVAKDFTVKDEKNNNLLHLIGFNGTPTPSEEMKGALAALGAMAKKVVGMDVSKYAAIENFKTIFKNAPQLLNEKNVYGETPLSVASMTGQTDIMNLALKNGADPEVPFMGRMQPGMYPFQIAIMLKNDELIDLFLAKNVNVNAKDENETPTNIYAGLAGTQVATLVKLENAGMNFHEMNKEGQNMLHMYLTRQEVDHAALSYILDQKVDPNVSAYIQADGFKIEMAPIDLAVMKRDEEAVDLLLKHQANPSTALFALRSKDIAHFGEVIKKFQIYGAVEAPKEEDMQKKMDDMAVKEKEAVYAIIDKLVAHGAKLDNQDKDGETPLFAAIEKKDELVCQALLDKGADPFVKNKEGISPLLKALFENPVLWEKILTTKGQAQIIKSNPEIILDAVFNSPEAGRRVFIENLKKIEDASAFKLTNEDGNSPLIVAAATSQEDVIEVLIEKGVDVNAVNHAKENALFHAVSQNSPYAVTLLLKAGADYNAKLADGTELKMFANYNSSASTNRALLEGIRARENPAPLVTEEAEAEKTKKAKIGP